jgi:cytochrome c
MRFGNLIAMTSIAVASALAVPAQAAPANADAGRRLVMQSCISCHAAETSKAATDGAPPLSFVAKDNKQNPAWIRGWLMDPHPPMPGIMLSRQQIEDIIAYLDTLPAQ